MSEDMSTMPLLDKNRSSSTQNIQSINYAKGDIENNRSLQQNDQPEGDNNQSLIKGKIENFDNPIERYNLVMNEYNNEINQIDGVQLSLLNNSQLVGWFNKIFTKPSSKWITAFFLLFASGFNVIFFFVFLVTFCIYMSNYRVHVKNESKVADPFQKMIYCEEMCESMNVSWYYFKLNVEGKIYYLLFFSNFLLNYIRFSSGLVGFYLLLILKTQLNPYQLFVLLNIEMGNFSFNFDTMNFIKDRIKDSIVEFMVYDIKFYENYTQFIKVKGRFIRWIFASLLLIGINAAVVVIILDIVVIRHL